MCQEHIRVFNCDHVEVHVKFCVPAITHGHKCNDPLKVRRFTRSPCADCGPNPFEHIKNDTPFGQWSSQADASKSGEDSKKGVSLEVEEKTTK